jgi:hypothetical protein
MYSRQSITNTLLQRLPGDDSNYSADDYNAIHVMIHDAAPEIDASNHDSMLAAVKDLIYEAEGPGNECIECLFILLAINNEHSKDGDKGLYASGSASPNGSSEDEDDQDYHRAVSYWNPNSTHNGKEEDAEDKENDLMNADYPECDSDSHSDSDSGSEDGNSESSPKSS